MNTERARKYITPGLAKYDSLKKLEGHDPIFFSFLSGYAGNSFLFEDFFIEKRCFVAAEPGWGKTRLLKEIIVEAAKKGKPGIFIDLKKAGKDHETFLSKPLNITETITAGISGQKLKEMTLFKTGNFDLKDPDDSIICLDALDEVKQQDFADVVDQIKYLSKKMKNTHIVISCRTHHLKKNANLFHNMDFIYIAIEDFDEDKIKQYLGESGLTAGQIKKIHDILESGNRQLPISVPRYLEILIDFVDKEGVDSLEKLTRGELLDFFIYRKLECEEDKIKKQHKDITKRVLEKLALLMEIYQTNTLTKDELMSFFDDVKSGLKNNFLQQVKLEVFYDRSLIKDNIDTVEFENTSFQEFLAAKEILRLGRTEQVIFDLAVDKELREIYPAWLDTLEFVIDLDISILKPILDFASSRSETINTEECYRLLTTMNTNRLSLDQRKEIFKTVLDYYQQKSACIDLGVARKLSYYFDISQDELLKGYIDKRKSSGSVPATRKGNVAEVIAYLFENDKLDNRRISYWKNKLIEFACDKNPGLNRTALSALSKLKDLKVLQKIYHLFQRHDELTNQVFLQACIEINPNDPFSIDCFIIGGKKGNIFAHSGLEQITERKAIIYLLDRLINKKDHFYRFVDPSYNRYSGNKYDTIFQNIRNVYDPGIEKKMVTLANAVISDSFSHYFRFSDFTAHVLKLIREKNKSYIFDLIADEKLLDNIQSKYSIFEHIFSLLLRKEQIDRFVKELEPLAIKRNIALNSL
ncbi:MAG: NACHT domain-containing protein, partial [Candidatus Aminicenantes bacterium]|nr:NACHT domain-containing protein [Candidatus Aminicenantes bacterium]